MKYIQLTKRGSELLVYINVNYIVSVTSEFIFGEFITCITTVECDAGSSWRVNESLEEVMDMIDEVTK